MKAVSSQSADVLYWIFVTCIVPIAVPVLVNMFFWAVPSEKMPRGQSSWSFPIKDGQLFWVVLGLSASALYELPSSLPFHSAMSSVLWGAISVSCLLGAIGSIWPVDETDPNANWLRRSGLLWHSLLLLGLVGSLFTLIHFASQRY